MVAVGWFVQAGIVDERGAVNIEVAVVVEILAELVGHALAGGVIEVAGITPGRIVAPGRVDVVAAADLRVAPPRQSWTLVCGMLSVVSNDELFVATMPS